MLRAGSYRHRFLCVLLTPRRTRLHGSHGHVSAAGLPDRRYGTEQQESAPEAVTYAMRGAVRKAAQKSHRAQWADKANLRLRDLNPFGQMRAARGGEAPSRPLGARVPTPGSGLKSLVVDLSQLPEYRRRMDEVTRREKQEAERSGNKEHVELPAEHERVRWSTRALSASREQLRTDLLWLSGMLKNWVSALQLLERSGGLEAMQHHRDHLRMFMEAARECGEVEAADHAFSLLKRAHGVETDDFNVILWLHANNGSLKRVVSTLKEMHANGGESVRPDLSSYCALLIALRRSDPGMASKYDLEEVSDLFPQMREAKALPALWGELEMMWKNWRSTAAQAARAFKPQFCKGTTERYNLLLQAYSLYGHTASAVQTLTSMRDSNCPSSEDSVCLLLRIVKKPETALEILTSMQVPQTPLIREATFSCLLRAGQFDEALGVVEEMLREPGTLPTPAMICSLALKHPSDELVLGVLLRMHERRPWNTVDFKMVIEITRDLVTSGKPVSVAALRERCNQGTTFLRRAEKKAELNQPGVDINRRIYVCRKWYQEELEYGDERGVESALNALASAYLESPRTDHHEFFRDLLRDQFTLPRISGKVLKRALAKFNAEDDLDIIDRLLRKLAQRGDAIPRVALEQYTRYALLAGDLGRALDVAERFSPNYEKEQVQGFLPPFHSIFDVMLEHALEVGENRDEVVTEILSHVKEHQYTLTQRGREALWRMECSDGASEHVWAGVEELLSTISDDMHESRYRRLEVLCSAMSVFFDFRLEEDFIEAFRRLWLMAERGFYPLYKWRVSGLRYGITFGHKALDLWMQWMGSVGDFEQMRQMCDLFLGENTFRKRLLSSYVNACTAVGSARDILDAVTYTNELEYIEQSVYNHIVEHFAKTHHDYIEFADALMREYVKRTGKYPDSDAMAIASRFNLSATVRTKDPKTLMYLMSKAPKDVEER